MTLPCKLSFIAFYYMTCGYSNGLTISCLGLTGFQNLSDLNIIVTNQDLLLCLQNGWNDVLRHDFVNIFFPNKIL